MTQASKRIQTQFTKASKHPVVPNAAGGVVACVNCHNVHEESAANKVSDPDNTYNSINYGTVAEKATYCLRCHDGNVPGAWQVNPSLVMTPVVIPASDAATMNKSTYAGESHWTAHDSLAAGQEVACAGCHDNHGSAAPKLLGSYNATSDINTIGVATINANDNSVCYACHTAAMLTESWTASGYPNAGPWSGQATYTLTYSVANHTGSAHTSAGAVWPASGLPGGDCKNCHDVHGTVNAYDELVTTFTVGQFQLCFTCHDTSPAADDVKSKYPVKAGGTNATDARSGHRTITGGLLLPPDSAMPCYACHNPHGSLSAYNLEVHTQVSAGVTIVVGDNAGDLTMGTGRTAAQVRQFCFTCHTTGDTYKGWNGTAYIAVGTANVRAMGYDRYATTGKLRLSNSGKHNEASAENCLGCHGDPHNPTGGGSSGGLECLDCHKDSQFAGMFTGQTNTRNTFHHAMESSVAGTPGDQAPNTGAYPTDTQVLYCVSCHTDHNYFNGTANNLRTGIGLAGSNVTNTDWSAASPYGICLSCHATQLTRDNANQKDTGMTNVIAIDPGLYAASKHNYTAAGTAAGPFNANCSKCHDDEAATSYFSGTYKFGTHASAEKSILALGDLSAVATGTTEEEACYRCHSQDAARNPNAAAGRDYYNSRDMSASALDVYDAMIKTSQHDVDNANWAGRHKASEFASAPASTTATGWWGATKGIHVECADCHDVHAAKQDSYRFPDNHTSGDAGRRTTSTVPAISDANISVWGVQVVSMTATGSWPGSGTAGATTSTARPPLYSKLATSSYEWQMCLKCHSPYAWGSTSATPSLLTGQIKGTATPGSTNPPAC